MGNLLDRSVYRNHERSLKRQREHTPDKNSESSNSRNTSAIDPVLLTPKRRKIQSTSKYIYQTLFLNGEESDITIHALNKNWNLHRFYISQSPYFRCMLNGEWKESSQAVIYIDIADPEINERALKIVFGSMYNDFVFIKPVEVVSVLAAATMFQLDSVLEQCSSLMMETLRCENVCQYYYASLKYGLMKVKEACFKWLLTNILCEVTPDVLRNIESELLCQLLSNPDLFVMQVETDIYSLLKCWVFTHLNPDWTGSNKELSTAADTFFLHLQEGDSQCDPFPSSGSFPTTRDNSLFEPSPDFPENMTAGTNKKLLPDPNDISESPKDEEKASTFLETSRGAKFLAPFRCVRWQNLITDVSSLKILEKDRIVNKEWISPYFEYQWKKMLDIDTAVDMGPQNAQVKASLFYRLSVRSGRVIKQDGQYCWRWVGYNFGVDLLVNYSNRVFTLKRNTHSQTYQGSVSLRPQRHVVYRLRVASIDENKNVKMAKSTEIKHHAFNKDEEVSVLTLDKDMSFPLYVGMNLLSCTPSEEDLVDITFGI